jgi:hypothetical protein
VDLHVDAACLGEVKFPAPVAFLAFGEAFFLEMPENGVHRPGARAPGASTAFTDFPDDLVPMAWLLVQEYQYSRADPTPTHHRNLKMKGSSQAGRRHQAPGHVILALDGTMTHALLIDLSRPDPIALVTARLPFQPTLGMSSPN